MCKIEKANIMELDWAMANMESKGPKSKGKGKSDELVQMDIKGDVSRLLMSAIADYSPMSHRRIFAALEHSCLTMSTRVSTHIIFY